MAEHFFAYLARMKYIGRWGLMRSTIPENLQEHSHMTAVLAHALAVIRRDVLGGDADPDAAAVAALFHDAPEILTGDLPTPVKYHSPEIRAAYRRVEEQSAQTLLSMLPESMRPAYEPWLREEYDPELRALVKAADKLSAYLKMRRGTAGRQRRIPPRRGTDTGRAPGYGAARGGVFYGSLPAWIRPHTGRITGIS